MLLESDVEDGNWLSQDKQGVENVERRAGVAQISRVMVPTKTIYYRKRLRHVVISRVAKKARVALVGPIRGFLILSALPYEGPHTVITCDRTICSKYLARHTTRPFGSVLTLNICS